MYCRKEMVKIFKCYLIPKKSYGTLSKDAIFFWPTLCIAAIELNSYLLHLIKTNVFGNISPHQVITCTKLKNEKSIL